MKGPLQKLDLDDDNMLTFQEFAAGFDLFDTKGQWHNRLRRDECDICVRSGLRDFLELSFAFNSFVVQNVTCKASIVLRVRLQNGLEPKTPT